MLKKKKLKLGIIILLFGLGIYFLSYPYIQKKKDKIYNNINLLLYEKENPDYINSNQELEEEEIINSTDSSNSINDHLNNNINDHLDENNNQNDTTNNNQHNFIDNIIDFTNNNFNTSINKPNNKPYYIGKINIPKINLEKGFVDPDSKYNDVHYNITIINTSTMPNVDKGNLILAAHSGNCTVCYFDKLYQLEINDIIEVYYQNIKYTYTITKIYTQPKTGSITIYRDYQKKSITLVTCTNNDDSTQTIYIGEIQKEESY